MSEWEEDCSVHVDSRVGILVDCDHVSPLTLVQCPRIGKFGWKQHPTNSNFPLFYISLRGFFSFLDFNRTFFTSPIYQQFFKLRGGLIIIYFVLLWSGGWGGLFLLWSGPGVKGGNFFIFSSSCLPINQWALGPPHPSRPSPGSWPPYTGCGKSSVVLDQLYVD